MRPPAPPRFLAVAAAALVIVCAAPVLPEARAEVLATGSRISVAGGPVKPYMSYGYPNDPEFYAPIALELRRHEVLIETRGEFLWVYHRGQKVAEWDIVRDRTNVPDNPNVPFALQWGGQTYLPVNAICELVGLAVDWDRRVNQIALNPSNRPRNVGTRPRPNVTAEPRTALLTGVHLERRGSRIELRITSQGTVIPRKPFVVNAPPRRLVLDFPNSRWADSAQAPAAVAEVKEVRIGHPESTVARVTLVVTAADLSVVSLVVDRDRVVAQVGRGTAVARASVTEEIQRALRDRAAARPGLADRSLTQGGIVLDERGVIVLPEGTGPIGPSTPGLPVPVPAPIEGPGIEYEPVGRYQPATTLQGRRIVLDAGHGGKDVGARRLFSYEKDLTLRMIKELEASLRAKGAEIILTRANDSYVTLDQRCQLTNQSGADVFISIHVNAMPRRNQQSGSESYWYSSQQSLRLARALHPRLVAAVQGRNGGIRRRSFQVIRETNVPSVLLEVAYVNHTEDEILLNDRNFHARLAELLTRGVLDYFGRPLD